MQSYADGFNFAGGTVYQMPTDDIYFRYNPETRNFNIQNDKEQLPPFRAWLSLAKGWSDSTPTEEVSDVTSGTWPRSLRMNIDFFDNKTTTSIMSVVKDITSTIAFSLNGIRQQSGLQAKGLYIVGGKKIMVR